jgi:hypothetical protein
MLDDWYDELPGTYVGWLGDPIVLEQEVRRRIRHETIVTRARDLEPQIRRTDKHRTADAMRQRARRAKITARVEAAISLGLAERPKWTGDSAKLYRERVHIARVMEELEQMDLSTTEKGESII